MYMDVDMGCCTEAPQQGFHAQRFVREDALQAILGLIAIARALPRHGASTQERKRLELHV